jgi:cobalt/nickel transport system ATP-binding protein
MDDLIRLSVKKVSFKYPGGTQSLSDIDLEIRRGEFIGILGANGSGKTTLLKVMDGLLKDCEGSVRLDGKEIRVLSPKEIYRKVGLIFQNSDEQLFAPTVSKMWLSDRSTWDFLERKWLSG